MILISMMNHLSILQKIQAKAGWKRQQKKKAIPNRMFIKLGGALIARHPIPS